MRMKLREKTDAEKENEELKPKNEEKNKVQV